MRSDSPSVYARNTASDIIDMIVDLKIDLSSFGEKHAQQIDADGFVTIKSTPYERVAHEQ
jgi:predicted phosphohydrolase